MPLSVAELNSFYNYIEEVKVAGTSIDVLSQDGDVIDSIADVFYDGNYTIEQIKENINSSLTNYRLGLNTGGIILKNELIKAVIETPGVDDILFTALTVTAFGQAADNIVREHQLTAGYFNYAEEMINNWTFTPRSVI